MRCILCHLESFRCIGVHNKVNSKCISTTLQCAVGNTIYIVKQCGKKTKTHQTQVVAMGKQNISPLLKTLEDVRAAPYVYYISFSDIYLHSSFLFVLFWPCNLSHWQLREEVLIIGFVRCS